MGWFTACLNTMGQFAILAGIDWGLATFVIGLLGWPATQATTVAVFTALMFSHALLNHLGIRVVARLNDFSAWYHIAVVFFILIVLSARGFTQPVSFLFKFNSTDGYSRPYSFIVGLLLAQWTLTGYDASAHVSEETRDPRRNAPWGIFIAVAISIVFGFLMLAAITLSIPDLAQATAFGDNALIEVMKLRLGPGMGCALVWLICGAMWLCGLGAMTSASRMVFAFSRDGGLPAHKVWAAVSKNAPNAGQRDMGPVRLRFASCRLRQRLQRGAFNRGYLSLSVLRIADRVADVRPPHRQRRRDRALEPRSVEHHHRHRRDSLDRLYFRRLSSCRPTSRPGG